MISSSSGEVTRFIGTMLDITESKNAEILLQRAKDEAEEANQAKDHFLYDRERGCCTSLMACAGGIKAISGSAMR